MTEKIHLLDVVAMTHDKPEEKVHRGQVGTVVELLDDDVFLVEFSDTDGETYAMVELRAEELMRLHHEPSASA